MIIGVLYFIVSVLSFFFFGIVYENMKEKENVSVTLKDVFVIFVLSLLFPVTWIFVLVSCIAETINEKNGGDNNEKFY